MEQPKSTPRSERLHLTLLGRCNSGKSTLINSLTGQHSAIVSDIAGTTTDPVSKSIELPSVGAAVIIDTAGIDDCSPLAEERMAATRRALDTTDIALILFGSADTQIEEPWLEELRRRKITIIGVLSQCDRHADHAATAKAIESRTGLKIVCTSGTTGRGIDELLVTIASIWQTEERLLTEGLCRAGDRVLLVMPQDGSAPKGRLIMPQVQTLRELLDRGCTATCCTPDTMELALRSMNKPPQLIITDSQVFGFVADRKPKASRLTSFSVLQARYKGDIESFVEGAHRLLGLHPTARILIAEACTHRPQNEDIGRVKLPHLLHKRLGERLHIDIVGGADFPTDLSSYDLIIHCGACMFTRRHVMSRLAAAQQAGVPITNYGIAIAALTGILDKVDY